MPVPIIILSVAKSRGSQFVGTALFNLATTSTPHPPPPVSPLKITFIYFCGIFLPNWADSPPNYGIITRIHLGFYYHSLFLGFLLTAKNYLSLGRIINTDKRRLLTHSWWSLEGNSDHIRGHDCSARFCFKVKTSATLTYLVIYAVLACALIFSLGCVITAPLFSISKEVGCSRRTIHHIARCTMM